ncbi:hypothetical protein Ciccas_011864 [Cichlidogyrus casuarinus]|uniref:Uncharacterized protein n=1 Tax=Cichlidogyrus casuarinus TaxID=1844966 RepID=A0ABD2PQ13_9PLAT
MKQKGKTQELQLELQSVKSRLSRYEGLEEEIDWTISKHGQSAKPFIPTLNERRVEHSIKLSSDLLAARRKILDLENENKRLLSELQVI